MCFVLAMFRKEGQGQQLCGKPRKSLRSYLGKKVA